MHRIALCTGLYFYLCLLAIYCTFLAFSVLHCSTVFTLISFLVPFHPYILYQNFVSSHFEFFSAILKFVQQRINRRGKGTSSVAFEVLIINCKIYFINLFIFNCLTLNTKLLIFKLFDVKLLFSENHAFRKQKRTAVYGSVDARP